MHNSISDQSPIDRLPPHSFEAEQGVLGCQLISPRDCIDEVVERFGLRVNGAFYDLRNQTIQDCLLQMSESKEEIDVITVQQRLKDKQLLEQCGGIAYLSQLQDSVPSAANLSYYLDILDEKMLLRSILKTCSGISGKVAGFAGSVDLLLDEAERDILKIRPTRKDASDIKHLVRSAVDRIEIKFNTKTISGLSTGLKDLDWKTDGMHGGEVIIVAGLPSTGKSALSTNICVSVGLSGLAAAVFTAEMQPTQLVVRSICSESRVNFHRMSESDIPKMTAAATKISNSKLHIEPASGLSIGQVQAIARRLKQKDDIKLIVVDYIQLLSGRGDNREQEISSISKGIRSMALELNVPVLALSQLTDDGKLRESRSIGQDADSVWKLENNGEWKPDIQPITLRIEKCRDGSTGEVPLIFMKEFTKFVDAAKFSGDDVPTTK